MPTSDLEPHLDSADPAEQLVAYLDYYREAVARKLDGMTDQQTRTSVLPSGWAPLQLLNHLVHMERRWFLWGFLAEQVPDPWGDHVGGRPDGAWVLPEGATVPGLLQELHAVGRRTTQVLSSTPLATRGAVGGRFTSPPAPPLAWIGVHVLQEYARHVGHLDVVRELADGLTGE